MTNMHDEVFIVSINYGEEEQHIFDKNDAYKLFDDLANDPADHYDNIRLIKYTFETGEEEILDSLEFEAFREMPLPEGYELVEAGEGPEVEILPESADYKQYTKLVYTTQAIANDMKYIHWNCCGCQFDRIHEITEEYYNKLNTDLDFFAELALEYPGITLANPSNMARKLDWPCIEDTNSIDSKRALELISGLICSYITSLKEVYYEEDGVIPADVKSELDSIIRFWTKEINYKIARRRKDCE